MPRQATRQATRQAGSRQKDPARTAADSRPPLTGEAGANEVSVRGRVTAAPLERELPSGTRIATFRISVRRASTTMTRGSRQQADWIDCSVWTAALRRTTSRWQVGDTVEVSGSFRRRFLGARGSVNSMVEIEVDSARRVAKGDKDGAAQSGDAQSG